MSEGRKTVGAAVGAAGEDGVAEVEAVLLLQVEVCHL